MAQLTLIRGDRETITVTVSGLGPGVAITAAEFTLKRRLDDADPGVLQKTILNGGIVITGGNVLTVTILPADLSWISYQDRAFFYDCQVSLSDGSGPVTVDSGRIRLRLDATRLLT